AASAAIQQSHLQSEPASALEGGLGLEGYIPEGLVKDLQGQSLTSIAKGGAGLRAQGFGQGLATGAEAIGAPVQGILDDVSQAVIIAEALKNQVPESDQRSK